MKNKLCIFCFRWSEQRACNSVCVLELKWLLFNGLGYIPHYSKPQNDYLEFTQLTNHIIMLINNSEWKYLKGGNFCQWMGQHTAKAWTACANILYHHVHVWNVDLYILRCTVSFGHHSLAFFSIVKKRLIAS